MPTHLNPRFLPHRPQRAGGVGHLPDKCAIVRLGNFLFLQRLPVEPKLTVSQFE